MKDLFLKIDDFLKSFNKKYVYCGSISLYLNGMDINNFDDIDVDFIDCTEDEKVFIWPLGGPLELDKLSPIEEIPIEYKEIEFEGRKLLVSTLEYELKAREYLLQIPNYHKIEKVKNRIKQIKDYLNK